jgi:hypothetical protein
VSNITHPLKIFKLMMNFDMVGIVAYFSK